MSETEEGWRPGPGDIKNGVAYGCHVEIEAGEKPDGCVIDYGAPGDCNYGIYRNGHPRRTKWTCKFWRKLADQSAVAAQEPTQDQTS